MEDFTRKRYKVQHLEIFYKIFPCVQEKKSVKSAAPTKQGAFNLQKTMNASIISKKYIL